MGIVYLGLAAVSVARVGGRAGVPLRRSGRPTRRRASARRCCCSPRSAERFSCPGRIVSAPSPGCSAFVAGLRMALDAHRGGVRETLAFVGGALGTLAASFLLVSISFEAGHIAATFLAAAVGALFLAAASKDPLDCAGRRFVRLARSRSRRVVRRRRGAVRRRCHGHLDRRVVGARGLGRSALRWLRAPRAGSCSTRARLAPGDRRTVAAVAASSGVAYLEPDDARPAGVGLLLIALAYGALAAGVFPREGFRNASTILWTLGLVLLIGAESLLVGDDVARSVVIAVTALAVAALARPLRESRLWLAGGSLALSTTAIVLLVQVQPWLADGEIARRLAIASGVCAASLFGVAALVWGSERWRDLSTRGLGRWSRRAARDRASAARRLARNCGRGRPHRSGTRAGGAPAS